MANIEYRLGILRINEDNHNNGYNPVTSYIVSHRGFKDKADTKTKLDARLNMAVALCDSTNPEDF